MPSVNDMFPSDWIKGEDVLDAGGRMTLQISQCIAEPGKDYRTGKTVDKWNLYFHTTEKKLTLGRTNANILAEMFGDNSDAWANQWITLYTTKQNVGGEMKDVVYIDNKPAQPGGGTPAPQAPAPAPVYQQPQPAPAPAPALVPQQQPLTPQQPQPQAPAPQAAPQTAPQPAQPQQLDEAGRPIPANFRIEDTPFS